MNTSISHREKDFADERRRREAAAHPVAWRLRRPVLTGVRPGQAAGAAIGISLVAVLCFPVIFEHIGPILYQFDDARVLARPASTVWLDANGDPIGATIAEDDVWRIPVPLSEVSPHLIAAAVAVEDRRFFRHHGVDWRAAARALIQDIRSGRIVSGASTITMQLARLAYPEPRSLGRKLRQTCRALDIERRHTKRWILEQYFNNAPYGGNIIGVEAAALAYFGKHARDLDVAESALLAGLPQRPSFLRPDRHLDRALRRQRRVLDAMLETKRITLAEYQEALHVAREVIPVEIEQTAEARGNRLHVPCVRPVVCTAAARLGGRRPGYVRTTIDPRVQDIVENALRYNRRAAGNGVRDAAAIVIENDRNVVRAYVGSLDPDRPDDGLVDALLSPRSPGSLLKPVVVLLALNRGLVVPETIVSDAPLPADDYQPGNFTGDFHGAVSVRDALCASLNTPAVRLLRRVGLNDFLDTLAACGIRLRRPDPGRSGLTAVLGGIEAAPLDIASFYAAIARGGSFLPCSMVQRKGQIGLHESTPVKRLPFAPGAVALLTDMLAGHVLPGAPGVPAAWKTGTSSGGRDAWCAAWNRRYTVLVWFGNKNGRPTPGLTGVGVAAPAAGAILAALCGSDPPPVRDYTRDSEILENVMLCERTGLRAGPWCRRKFRARCVRGIPLRLCSECRPAAADIAAGGPKRQKGRARPEVAGSQRVAIISPRPGEYLSPDGSPVRLRVAASKPGPLDWFVDGRFVGCRSEPFNITLSSGRHRIMCLAKNVKSRPASLEVLVRR